MQKYDTRVITAADFLAGGYDTRIVRPRTPCPRCRATRPEVIGAQCYRDGHIWGEFRCGQCGEIYGQPMPWR